MSAPEGRDDEFEIPPYRRPDWVTALAIINVLWVAIGLGLSSSGTMLAMVGLLVLPQPMMFVAYPELAWGIVALGFTHALVGGRLERKTHGGFASRFFTIGTVFLFVSLCAGPIFLLVAALRS